MGNDLVEAMVGCTLEEQAACFSRALNDGAPPPSARARAPDLDALDGTDRYRSILHRRNMELLHSMVLAVAADCTHLRIRTDHSGWHIHLVLLCPLQKEKP